MKERIDRAMMAMERMGNDEWVHVVTTFGANEAAIREAVEVPATISSDYSAGRRKPKGMTHEERRELIRMANRQVALIVARLPEHVGTPGTERTLREPAHTAVWHAMRGLLVHDELLAMPDGKSLLAALYAPFLAVDSSFGEI